MPRNNRQDKQEELNLEREERRERRASVTSVPSTTGSPEIENNHFQEVMSAGGAVPPAAGVQAVNITMTNEQFQELLGRFPVNGGAGGIAPANSRCHSSPGPSAPRARLLRVLLHASLEGRAL